VRGRELLRKSVVCHELGSKHMEHVLCDTFFIFVKQKPV
jgi:hypothetical protein